MTQWFFRFARLVPAFVSLMTIPAAAAQLDEPLRLIATSPTHRVWLTPAQVDELSTLNHLQGHCGGFMDITDEEEELLSVPEPKAFVDRALGQQAVVGKILPLLSSARILDTVTKLQGYKNRYYQSTTGREAAAWIKGRFEAMAVGRKDVTVTYFNHRFAQPSVIARIQGKGPLAKEKIIIGAHEDSINWEGSRPTASDRAPGADDNASGIAVLLETFHALMEAGVQPQRTIEFMAYAGEELGLLGSQDIAQAYKREAANVTAVLQMDMTMFPASLHKITLITDNVSPPLNAFTARLVDAYLDVPWQKSRCGYGCSDHASWDKVGYPAVFPFEAAFEEHNPNIHTVRDTLDNGMDHRFGLEFAKLTTAFALELGL